MINHAYPRSYTILITQLLSSFIFVSLILPGNANAGIKTQTGLASWYGAKFQNKRTASGMRFDKNKLTAAHRTLPLGSRVRVTNLRNGKSVVVLINDRGPFSKKRVIDLSYRAARVISLVHRGVSLVRLESCS